MSKLLGPPTGYVDMLIDSLEAKHKADHDSGKGYQKTPVRPSSVGNCARELYFQLRQFHGMENYPYIARPGETLLLLDLGHSIERHLVNKFRDHFKVAEVRYTQQVLSFGKITAVNNTNLSQLLEGSLDLCLWSEKYKVCADVKSKGDYWSFKDRMTGWDATSAKLEKLGSVERITDRLFWVDNLDTFLGELNDPFFEANFKQLNIYLNSDFLKERGVDHGSIIQYHKGKSLLREIRFRPSATVFAQGMEKLTNVVQAVDTGNIELAPAEYINTAFKQKFCNACQAKVPGSCAMIAKGKK
jgi:hypothetical protein